MATELPVTLSVLATRPNDSAVRLPPHFFCTITVTPLVMKCVRAFSMLSDQLSDLSNQMFKASNVLWIFELRHISS